MVLVPPSSWHWKVEPVFELVNEKLALVWLVGLAGCAVIVTVGGVVSIVQVALALPVFPAVSVAVTVKVWLPAASGPAYVFGLVHAVAVPPSSLQVNVEPVFELVKLKVAEVRFVGLSGCAVIVTVGGVVSIVQFAVTLPVLPAGSVAVTLKVCAPAARPV